MLFVFQSQYVLILTGNIRRVNRPGKVKGARILYHPSLYPPCGGNHRWIYILISYRLYISRSINLNKLSVGSDVRSYSLNRKWMLPKESLHIYLNMATLPFPVSPFDTQAIAHSFHILPAPFCAHFLAKDTPIWIVQYTLL